MDFNGDYPGSRVKRLKVDTTADIGTDLTVHGSVNINGDIKMRNITATDIKTTTLETDNFQADYANITLLDLTGTVPMLLNSTASAMAITSISSDIEISPYGTAMATFSGLGTTFHSPATFSSVGTVSDLVSTKCTLGSASCTTLTATSSSLGSASCTSLTATTSSLGVATASSLTTTVLSATNQLQTIFGSTAVQSVPNNSYVYCTAFNPTPLVSRGSPAVSLSGSTFTVNSTGMYQIGYYIVWNNNAIGLRSTCIRINGAPTNYVMDIRNAISVGAYATHNMGNINTYQAAGTTFQLEVFQNSGGALDLGNWGNQIITISFTRLY